jgi:hypothetical protein
MFQPFLCEEGKIVAATEILEKFPSTGVFVRACKYRSYAFLHKFLQKFFASDKIFLDSRAANLV